MTLRTDGRARNAFYTDLQGICGVRGGILYDHNGDKLKLRNIYGTSIEIDNARKSTFSGDIQITKPLSGDPGANLTLETHATANSNAKISLMLFNNNGVKPNKG